MSASNIADSLVTALSAASAFGTGNVSTNYAVLNSTSGSCAVITFSEFEIHQGVFGGGNGEIIWTFVVEAFAKDLGDAFSTRNRTFSTVDTVINVLKTDPTVQGSVEDLVAIRGGKAILGEDKILESGETGWIYMPIEVDLKEWPNG